MMNLKKWLIGTFMFAGVFAFLDAAEDRTVPQWQLLRGEVYFVQRDYYHAAACYLEAEDYYPKQVWPKLEACYQMLDDYKKAYEYACKQRGK